MCEARPNTTRRCSGHPRLFVWAWGLQARRVRGKGGRHTTGPPRAFRGFDRGLGSDFDRGSKAFQTHSNRRTSTYSTRTSAHVQVQNLWVACWSSGASGHSTTSESRGLRTYPTESIQQQKQGGGLAGCCQTQIFPRVEMPATTAAGMRMRFCAGSPVQTQMVGLGISVAQKRCRLRIRWSLEIKRASEGTCDVPYSLAGSGRRAYRRLGG